MFVFKDNICMDCNNEAIDLLGYESKEKVLGKGIIDIFADVSDTHHNELLDNKIDHYFEDKVINVNGNIYDVQIKERNVSIDGKLLKIVAVMDITDIKRNEKILSQQSKMASMGEMIGNIAHQWRQPLTAISVAAGGIKLNYEFDMEDRAETIEELDNIVENTQFLSATIEDFQNFLKNDRSAIAFSLKSTIQKTLTIIKANLEAQDIDVVQKYSGDIQLFGIQNDLVQVLLNIINNAVDVLKHRNDKKRYVLIEVLEEDNNAFINIYDSAGGVPKNIIDKVFEPYFTTKHQSQGTGLGLYMTHQIITKMNSSINVSNEKFNIKSEDYFGAKFSIKVPISQ